MLGKVIAVDKIVIATQSCNIRDTAAGGRKEERRNEGRMRKVNLNQLVPRPVAGAYLLPACLPVLVGASATGIFFNIAI